MRYRLLTAVLATALLPTGLCAQKFKREVDGWIRKFQRSMNENGSMGDGSCLQTAQILTAMGHSHRGYTRFDGPVTRKPLRFLFSQRGSDGLFRSPQDKDGQETSRWVLAALETMDPTHYAGDITAIKRLLDPKYRDKSVFEAIQVDLATFAPARGTFTTTTAEVGELLRLVRAQRLLVEQANSAAKAKGSYSPAQTRGFDYLMTQQEGGRFFLKVQIGQKDGKPQYMRHFDPGLTGIGLAALLTKPAALRKPAEQQTIDAGLAWLLEQQNEDGSVGKDTLNYTTCAAILALTKAKKPEYAGAIKKAQRFVLALQNVEQRDYSPRDRDYGSIGYGGDERGDLSNTQFAIEALRASGLDPQDEAFAKAILYLQKIQNLKSVNKTEIRTKDTKTGKFETMVPGNDGGSAYYPGNSPAGYIELPDGKKIPRSYGSMTYALLKTYTLCGVERDDPRLQAAVKWVEKHWDLDTNPGADPKLPEKYHYQGLYYYYMVMAQGLAAAGIDHLNPPAAEGAQPQKVDWRAELSKKLGSVQNADGSWLNEKNGRWYEELRMICSAYALLALEHCQ